MSNFGIILCSDKVWHSVVLSEQDMGVILHGLRVLEAAYSNDSEYVVCIDEAAKKINDAFHQPPLTVVDV